MKKSMEGSQTVNRLSTRVWSSCLAIGIAMVSLSVLMIVPIVEASSIDRLIHLYKFDEGSGSIAYDHMQTGAVNGVLSPKVARVEGLFGQGAVMLNGQTGSDVSFGSGVGQFGTSDFTVAFWFKTSETQRYFDLVGNRTAGSCGNFFQIRMSGISEFGNGVIVAEIAQDGGCANIISLRSGPGFSDGQWHHVAVTRSRSTMMLYVDGILVASDSAAGIANVANGNAFKIGRALADCCFETSFTPVATFDDLRIYRKALTAKKIRKLAH